MTNNDNDCSRGSIVFTIICMTILIGGTIICFVFKQYNGLFGISLCWLLAISGFIRAYRETH